MRFEPGQTFIAEGWGNPPKMKFEVLDIVGLGGQGFGYRVRETSFGWTAFAKTFHDEYLGSETAERIRWLVKAGLDHPGIVAPKYVILRNRRVVGHVSPAVHGKPLGELLYSDAGPDLATRYRFARWISRAVEYLHQRDIAHGDLSLANILSDGHHAHLIDLDNFQATGIPGAKMQGSPRYTAPSILAGGTPSIRTDVFSLAVILHETLLGRHPFIPPDTTGPAEERMQRAAVWLDDPRRFTSTHLKSGGAPMNWLGPGIADFFRRAFADRSDGVQEVRRSLDRLVPRDCACGGPTLRSHDHRPPCSWCGAPLPNAVRAVWKGGSRLLLPGTHTLGREDLKSPDVSRAHLRLTVGDDSVLPENLSGNGTRVVCVRGNRVPLAGTPIRLPISLELGSVLVELFWS